MAWKSQQLMDTYFYGTHEGQYVYVNLLMNYLLTSHVGVPLLGRRGGASSLFQTRGAKLIP